MTEPLSSLPSVPPMRRAERIREVLERSRRLLTAMTDFTSGAGSTAFYAPSYATETSRSSAAGGKSVAHIALGDRGDRPAAKNDDEYDDVSLLEELFFKDKAPKETQTQSSQTRRNPDNETERESQKPAKQGKPDTPSTSAATLQSSPQSQPQPQPKEMHNADCHLTSQKGSVSSAAMAMKPTLPLQLECLSQRQCGLWLRISRFRLRPRPPAPFQFVVRVLPSDGARDIVSCLYPPSAAVMASVAAFEGTVLLDLIAAKTLDHFRRNCIVVEVRHSGRAVALAKVPLNAVHDAVSRLRWSESLPLPCVGFRGAVDAVLLPMLVPGGSVDVVMVAGTLAQIRQFRVCELSATVIQRTVRNVLLPRIRRRERGRALGNETHTESARASPLHVQVAATSASATAYEGLVGRSVAIHVSIVRATGLDSAAAFVASHSVSLRHILDDGPSVFVRCSMIPGHPSTDTPVARASASPTINYRATFTVRVDGPVASQFVDGSATLDVFHMEQSPSSGSGLALILLGRASVPLRDLLSPPREIHGWFNILSSAGVDAGSLYVAMYAEDVSVPSGADDTASWSGWTIDRPHDEETTPQTSETAPTVPQEVQPPSPPVELSVAATQTDVATAVKEERCDGVHLKVGVIRGIRLPVAAKCRSLVSVEQPTDGNGLRKYFATEQSDGTSPFWGATGTVNVDHRDFASPKHPIVFRVLEVSAESGSQRVIGTAEVGIAVLASGMKEIHGWYSVQNDSGTSCGFLEVLITPDGQQLPTVRQSCKCPPTLSPRKAREPGELRGLETCELAQSEQRQQPPPAVETAAATAVPAEDQLCGSRIERVATTLIAAVDSQLQRDSNEALSGRLQQNMRELDTIHRALQERLEPPKPKQRVSPVKSVQFAEFKVPPPPKPPAFMASAFGAPPSRECPAPLAPPSRDPEVVRRRIGEFSDPEVERIARIMKTSGKR